jgi:hypothetical protein
LRTSSVALQGAMTTLAIDAAATAKGMVRVEASQLYERNVGKVTQGLGDVKCKRGSQQDCGFEDLIACLI